MKKLKPLRVLVCGGRDYADYPKVVYTLNTISGCGRRPVTIIHGGARGADALAGRWAFNTRTPHDVYPADWGALGEAAGPARNAEMLAKGKPDLVVAFPGGAGTADMVAKARAANVRVYEVPA